VNFALPRPNREMAEPRHRDVRWVVAGALTLITALNYLDRQTLPVMVSVIQRDIPISNAAFSQLQALFLLAYALMYAVGGRFVDVVGTRAGYAAAAAFWSVACMLHAAVSSVAGLGVARFLLGLGEGAGFPASAKAVAEWFPPRERSTAVGLFNTGSAVGAVAAPPLLFALVATGGWRSAFVVTGGLGLAWAGVWAWRYTPAGAGAPVGDGEGRLIPASAGPPAGAPLPWRTLLRIPQVVTLVVVKFLTDGAWFFFVFWLPKYLGDARGFDLAQVGAYAWIPYAAAGVGSLVGGWFSSRLIRRGFSLSASRKVALAMSAALMPASLLVVSSPVSLALAFVSVAFLGHQFWSVIVQTLPTDLFPARMVGSVAGLIGCAGSLGAMLFNLAVGWSLDAFGGYGPAFVVAGLMHPLSLLVFLATVRRIEPLDLGQPEGSGAPMPPASAAGAGKG
jgi:ACS family hexuronate transporter-like MFS transporter